MSQMAPQAPKHPLGDYISGSFDIFKEDIVNWIIIGLVGSLALGVGAWGGFHYCTIKAQRGEKPGVGDVLYPFQRFGDFIMPVLFQFLAVFLLGWLCGAGLILAVVLQAWWIYAYPLMIERNMSWKDASALSKEVATQDLMGHVILAIVAGFVANIGGVVGLTFITIPLIGMIHVLAYNKAFGAGAGAPAQIQGAAPGQPAWGGPAQQPAPAAAPAPGAPAQGGWNQPQGAAPAPAPAQGGWNQPQGAAPAPAPAQQPAQGGWNQPQAAAPAPAAQPAAPAAPAAAPAPQPAAPAAAWGDAPAPAPAQEQGVQSTTDNPDEVVQGKTMAMTSIDFEAMLADKNKNNQ